MSSIARNFNAAHQYPQLKLLSSKDLKQSQNIILIIIDGLGYNFLKKQTSSFLHAQLKSSLNSTFLATTACANTVFFTGYPSQQHGLTGWDINLKEIGTITTILPFMARYGSEVLSQANFRMKDIIQIESFHQNLQALSFTVIDQELAESDFSTYINRDTEIVGAAGHEQISKTVSLIINKPSSSRKFITAYLPELDSLAHQSGVNSQKVQDFFAELDKKLRDLSQEIAQTNTKLIITADHGFIDTDPEHEIWVEDIPGLKECLTIPLAGEPRVRDCFVRPRKVKTFEKIMKEVMQKYCWFFKGEQLIDDHFYGLGQPNPKLLDRVGDYVVIMKENYILRDKLANYEKPDIFYQGVHGGISEDEVVVPLVVLDC